MTCQKLALAAAAVGAFALASPASAQHSGHMPGMNMPGMVMPAPKKPAAKKKAPAVKKKAAAKAPAKVKSAVRPKAQPARPEPVKQPAADPHAGHDMDAMPGMDMPAAPATDPHAGHDMGAMPGMASEAPAGTDLPAGNAPPPPLPADHAADAVYGAGEMAMGRHHLVQHHGGQKLGQLMFNLAEYQVRKGRDGFEWNGEAWYGGDIGRLWLKSEGEGSFGRAPERAEVQALYSHAIGPYFNLQGGVRYDFQPNPSRVYATVGLEGLAPGFFELEGALFLSNKGELMARAEGYYDQRVTQRLILQPRAELNFAAQNSRDLGIGAGLSNAEVGLRLRYDIAREFAPYVGVQYSHAFGRTRRYARDAWEDAGGWSLLTGVRLWL